MKLPEALQSFLNDNLDEGADISCTSAGDAIMWIIQPEVLSQFYVLVTWYEGSDEFSYINLTGKAVGKLSRLFLEDGVYIK